MTDSLPDGQNANGRPMRLSFGAKFILSVSLLLSIGALAIGAVLYSQGTQFKADATQRQLVLESIADLQSQLVDLNSQKRDLVTRIDATAVQLQQLGSSTTSAAVALEDQIQRRLSSMRTEMSAEMQKLKQNASEVASQVELLEIRFLLRAAMLRLRVRSDVNAAKSLIEDALARLQGSDNLMILPLKARLEDDLAALNQIDSVSSQSILLQLQEIEQDMPETQFALTLAAKSTESVAEASLWQQVLNALGELIRVRKLDLDDVSDFDARVYLNDAERKLAEVKFDIAMTQARAAVLVRNTQGFRQQLQNLRDWHTKYSDAESAATASNLAAIQTLSELELAPTPYDLTEALKLLDQLLDQRI